MNSLLSRCPFAASLLLTLILSGIASRAEGQSEPPIFPPTQDEGAMQVDPVRPEPKDPVFIDKSVVGWKQAGLGNNGGRVDDQLRANWVYLDQRSGISGTIVGATEPMTVYLLRNGFMVSEVETDANGDFKIETGSAGSYTLVGYNHGAMFAFGFIAVDAPFEGAPQMLVINTLPVTGKDNLDLIADQIADHAPSVRFPRYGLYDIGETTEDPPEFYGVEGLVNLRQNIAAATTLADHDIVIQRDGRILGRVHKLNERTSRPARVNQTYLRLIQAGQVVAESQADIYGVFEFSEIAPGTYGLIATGSDGLAVASVQVVEGTFEMQQPADAGPDDEARNTIFRDQFHNAGFARQQGPQVIDLLLCDSEATGWINAFAAEQAYKRAMAEPRPEIQQPWYGDLGFPYGGYGGGGYGWGDGGACGGCGSSSCHGECGFGGCGQCGSPHCHGGCGHHHGIDIHSDCGCGQPGCNDCGSSTRVRVEVHQGAGNSIVVPHSHDVVIPHGQ